MHTIEVLVVLCNGEAHIEAREGRCSSRYQRHADGTWMRSVDEHTPLEIVDYPTILMLNSVVDWTP